jgi:hypothetical protein
MKWFDQWFTKKVHHAISVPQEKEQNEFNIIHTNRKKISIGHNSDTVRGGDSPRSLNAEGMTFTLYKSCGGFVLETHRYDSKADRRTNELYMIDEEKDFATQVAQAIMMESMKL